ncbi:MAG: hypothetical protein KDD44_11035 [Bdellovibrionales bacterium]|nr:hypothetical protein [Bdellovibrionales bacterium]
MTYISSYDFSVVRGREAEPAGRCRIVSLSLGTCPSPMVMAVVEGSRAGIGGQIAAAKAVEALREHSIESHEPLPLEAPEILRGLFRRANAEVFRYAESFAGDRRVSANMLALAYDGSRATIAQCSPCESYVWRGGTLERFHPIDEDGESGERLLARQLGAQSSIVVDLATIALVPGDLVIATTAPPADALLEHVRELVPRLGHGPELSRAICAWLADIQRPDSAERFQSDVVCLLYVQ